MSDKWRCRKDDLKGTQTEKNLLEAFAGESEARNKYTYFASKAKKDGYVQISKMFEETAANEKEHAKIWYKILEGIGSTPENLKALGEAGLDELTVRRTSGRRCIRALRRQRVRKALMRSRSFLKV